MSGTSDSNLEAEEFRNTLTAYMTHNYDYDLEDVRKVLINIDEVIIKYESLDVEGRKLNSTLNVMVGTAMNGDKFKPVIIGEGFVGVALDTIPVNYYMSDNAWMMRDILRHWFINHLLPELRNRYGPDQTVIALLDNHPAHPFDLDDLDP